MALWNFDLLWKKIVLWQKKTMVLLKKTMALWEKNYDNN